MYDATITANQITRWSNDLGVKLPKELTKSIELWEQLNRIDGPDLSVKYADLTVDGLEMTIDSIAGELAANDKRVEAKNRVTQVIRPQLLQAASAAVPGIIDQIGRAHV